MASARLYRHGRPTAQTRSRQSRCVSTQGSAVLYYCAPLSCYCVRRGAHSLFVVAVLLSSRAVCTRMVSLSSRCDLRELIVHSQTFSSMRASPHHGCAVGVPRYPALDASVNHGRTAPPLIKCSSVPGHRSSTSGSSVTNTSCQHPLRGQLVMLHIGAVTTGRPSDRGPRRAVTTATPTHSGHCAAFCAFRIHRYGVVVSARHFGGAV
jgi:hypothetical protein